MVSFHDTGGPGPSRIPTRTQQWRDYLLTPLSRWASPRTSFRLLLYTYLSTYPRTTGNLQKSPSPLAKTHLITSCVGCLPLSGSYVYRVLGPLAVVVTTKQASQLPIVAAHKHLIIRPLGSTWSSVNWYIGQLETASARHHRTSIYLQTQV